MTKSKIADGARFFLTCLEILNISAILLHRAPDCRLLFYVQKRNSDLPIRAVKFGERMARNELTLKELMRPVIV